MTSQDFLRFYAITPLGMRVEFIYSVRHRRLPETPPCQLLGFVAYNTLTGEQHTFCFHPEFNQFLRHEVTQFSYFAMPEERFKSICRSSQRAFILFCQEQSIDEKDCICPQLF